MKKTILLFPVCFLLNCAHKPMEAPASYQEFDRPVLAIDAESPLYKEALRFDKFIKRQLEANDEKQFILECKKKKIDSPFCYSVLHAKELYSLRENKTIPRIAPPPKQINPVSPLYKDGKVTNWASLRKSEIPELLKGLLPLSAQELTTLGEMALKEKKCPNRITIAVAATLEDYLPDQTRPEFLANLYEKGGTCRRESLADRENFMTRAALFYVYSQNWKKAENLLSRVTPNDAFSGRTLYWLAVARKNLNDQKGYEKALNRLLVMHPFSFHAVIASHRESVPLFPTLNTIPITPVLSKKSTAFNSILNQVEILTRNQFFQTANLLVDWGMGKFKKVESNAKLYLLSMGDAKARTLYAANLAYYKESFRTKDVLELAYPKPFESTFQKVQRGLPVHFLYSIARKESTFYPLAVSFADARGLMQLTVDTVERMGFKNANLFDPYTNLDIGALHLEELAKMLDGKLYFTAAAYNAGIMPVQSWRRRYRHSDVLLTIDLIPYRETREYVGGVLTNYYWYNKLYGNESSTFADLP